METYTQQTPEKELAVYYDA